MLELLEGGARLVTIVGPGGVGKTRLALEVAARRSGAALVPLGGLEDPAVVPTSITSALGDGETLVVLDEVEGVLAAAPAVAQLLARTPRLRLLATSRVPLRVAGEHEFHVAPLPARDAVALLRWQARALGVDPGGEEVQGEICRRLDGLPLAIELAAARLRALSARALLDRLDRRLDVLVGGRRDAPERQRTLRATIAWSHELLNLREQRVFAALAVFVGSCTVAMAEAVCEAALGDLESLVEQSLLRRAGDRLMMARDGARLWARAAGGPPRRGPLAPPACARVPRARRRGAEGWAPRRVAGAPGGGTPEPARRRAAPRRHGPRGPGRAPDGRRRRLPRSRPHRA